jgi:hypothetical protein
MQLFLQIYIMIIWRPHVAAPDHEYSESEVQGNQRKPPHLPVVGAGNFFDPGPARHMQEAKRGAQWRLQSPIGEEIVHCSRHDRCFSKTPPGLLTGKTSANG